MNDGLKFDWDDRKAASNLADHHVSFEAAHAFDFVAAVIVADTRKAYGERRWQATGPIGDRVHVLVYTVRGTAIRVISLRKANKREVKRYVGQIQNEP